MEYQEKKKSKKKDKKYILKIIIIQQLETHLDVSPCKETLKCEKELQSSLFLHLKRLNTSNQTKGQFAFWR